LFAALVAPIQRFFKLEAASGVLLLAAAVASLIWANESAATFERVFGLRLQIGVGTVRLAFTVRELVNDGLMTLLFFVVGMEIKRS
jgi:NhaA family Na+:H+ antiporter